MSFAIKRRLKDIFSSSSYFIKYQEKISFSRFYTKTPYQENRDDNDSAREENAARMAKLDSFAPASKGEPAEDDQLERAHSEPASPAEDSLAGRSGIYEAQQREPGKDRHHQLERRSVKTKRETGKKTNLFPPFLKAVLKNGFQEGKLFFQPWRLDPATLGWCVNQ